MSRKKSAFGAAKSFIFKLQVESEAEESNKSNDEMNVIMIIFHVICQVAHKDGDGHGIQLL